MAEPIDDWSGQVQLVDNTEELSTLLHNLKYSALISVGAKGQGLSGKGNVSILSLKLLGRVYLIDIATLQTVAFNHSVDCFSLRYILESTSVKKVIFDVRNLSNALFVLYGIQLQNVIDLQLYHLATRPSSKRQFVTGLEKALQHSNIFTPSEMVSFQYSREIFVEIFVPCQGGDEKLLLERPCAGSLVAYCALDVYFLERLYDHCRSQLRASWYAQISAATQKRLRASRRKDYEPWSSDKKLAPKEWFSSKGY